MTSKVPSERTAAADDPIAELAELRDVTPPPALVARVMTSLAAPRPLTLRQVLGRLLHAELRLSVRSALLLAAVAGAGAWGLRRAEPPAVTVAAAPPAATIEDSPAPVLVRFTFEDQRAHQVFVAGSFNDWNPIALDRDDGGRDDLFVATVALPRGVHEYMFLVDGNWVRDPLVSDSRPDGFGRQNSLLRL